MEAIAHFYIGDTITSMQKTSLVPGANDCLEFELFQNLEMHMRVEYPPLCGRDHLAYRSYYFPVKSVIDGDLCEQYALMPSDKQKSVGEELGRKPMEVLFII
ncbi:unnamed protein product [Gongylonema pulchrum]|uniref:RSE1/DDB1/CPSF1 C-terminal domain-containing protein n=1 Tax=Gongylonema pulchrum TaxID=637853 RepID=A0A3P6PLD3_9BILA|nr:unnamed protein product [Gongylonema pulchrum]